MEKIEVILQDVNEDVAAILIDATNADGKAATVLDVCRSKDARELFGITDDADQDELVDYLDVDDGWKKRILATAINTGDDPLVFNDEFDEEALQAARNETTVEAGVDTTAARGTAGVVTVLFNGGLTHCSVDIRNGVTTLQEVLTDPEVANIGVSKDTIDVAVIMLNNVDTVPRNLYGAQIMHNGDTVNVSTNKTHNKA